MQVAVSWLLNEDRSMQVIRFLKDWTLPVAICVGTAVYLMFYFVPQLDAVGDRLAPVIDTVFPVTVFLTLLVTFCRVDFHQMRPHRWHVGVLAAQLLLVGGCCAVIFAVGADPERKLLWESVLTCIIGPSAAAASVVTGKLGGNINTMTAFTVVSSLVAALMIPAVFPLLENTVHVDFWAAFAIILEKVTLVLIMPLALGWLIQHRAPQLCQRITSVPDLSFYLWALSLSITTGITVRNIVNSQATLHLLMMIAALSLVLCFVQFAIGRGIGRQLGEEVNSGQALFQKNTALSIWVAYMYLHPVASVGAGCYVLWQNVINSLELWHYRKSST